RRRGALRDHRHAAEALPIVDHVAALSVRVVEDSDPFVAEGLLAAGRIIGALRPEEGSTVPVPGDDPVAGGRRPDLRACNVATGISRVAGNQGALEGRSAGLG